MSRAGRREWPRTPALGSGPAMRCETPRCRCARRAVWSTGPPPAGGQLDGHPRDLTLARGRGLSAEEVEDVETVADKVDQRLRGEHRLATENGVRCQGRDACRQGGPLGGQRRGP